MPTREYRTSLEDEEVCSDNIVEYLPIDWCFNMSTSPYIDNFNVGLYDFFENVINENDTIEAESGFSICKERDEDTNLIPVDMLSSASQSHWTQR